MFSVNNTTSNTRNSQATENLKKLFEEIDALTRAKNYHPALIKCNDGLTMLAFGSYDTSEVSRYTTILNAKVSLINEFAKMEQMIEQIHQKTLRANQPTPGPNRFK